MGVAIDKPCHDEVAAIGFDANAGVSGECFGSIADFENFAAANDDGAVLMKIGSLIGRDLKGVGAEGQGLAAQRKGSVRRLLHRIAPKSMPPQPAPLPVTMVATCSQRERVGVRGCSTVKISLTSAASPLYPPHRSSCSRGPCPSPSPPPSAIAFRPAS